MNSELDQLLRSKVLLRLTDYLGKQPNSVLLIDQLVLAAVNNTLTASLLDALGFSTFYALQHYVPPNDESASCAAFTVLLAAQTHYALLVFLCKCLSLNRVVRVALLIFPWRRCGTMDTLMSNLRLFAASKSFRWDSATSVLTIDKLQIAFADANVALYASHRPRVMSLHEPLAFAQVRSHGDPFVFDVLHRALLDVLAAHLRAQSLQIVAYGADSLYIQKNLCKALREPALAETGLADQRATFQQSLDLCTAFLRGELTAVEFAERRQAIPCYYPHTLEILRHCSREKLEEQVKFLQFEPKPALYVEKAHSNLKLQLPTVEQHMLGQETIKTPISSVIIVDRSVDWVGAFVTPLSYGAVIEHNWAASGNSIQIAPSVLDEQAARAYGAAAGAPQSRVSVDLRGPIFESLLDTKLTEVAAELRCAALACKADGFSKPHLSLELLEKIKRRDKEWLELNLHLSLASYLLANVYNTPCFHQVLQLETAILSQSIKFSAALEVLLNLAWRKLPVCDFLRLLTLLLYARKTVLPAEKLQQVRSTTLSVYGSAGFYKLNALVTAGVIPTDKPAYGSAQLFNLTNAGAADAAKPKRAAECSALALNLQTQKVLASAEAVQTCEDVALPLVNFVAAHLDRSEKFANFDAYCATSVACARGTARAGITLLVFPHFVTRTEVAALEKLNHTHDNKLLVLAGEICGYRQFLDGMRPKRADDSTNVHEPPHLALGSREYRDELREFFD